MNFREEQEQESREALETSENVKMFENISSLDRFQILSNLDRFSSTVQVNEDTEKLRLVLKKVLLEEIIKSKYGDQNFYITSLNEISNALAHNRSDYSCSLVGCRFHDVLHRNYIVHLKRDHPNTIMQISLTGKCCIYHYL